MPFQFDIIKSSPSARPYEHASISSANQPHATQAQTQTIHTGAETLLAFLELFEQSEVSWYLRHGRERRWEWECRRWLWDAVVVEISQYHDQARMRGSRRTAGSMVLGCRMTVRGDPARLSRLAWRRHSRPRGCQINIKRVNGAQQTSDHEITTNLNT